MTTSELQMQDYYAARAPEYDAVYLKPERQADLRAIEGWLPGLFANATVLEVACGTGYWTAFIAAIAARIVAVDSARETLEIAQRRVRHGRVEFHVGDAYALPPMLGQFDAAFAGFWFSHVPRERQREFLQGLGRHLPTGARVVLLDNLYVEGSNHPISETDPRGNTYQTRQLADGSTHRVLKNFPAEEELHRLIEGLGRQGRFTAWQHFWAFEYVTV